VGDPSASRILFPSSEYNRAARATDEAFGGTERFMVVVEGDGPRALYHPEVLRTIERFQQTLGRLPIVAGSISLVDLLKGMRERFHESEPRWGAIPSNEADVASEFFLYWGSVYPSTSARYFTPDFSTAPITFFCRDHTVAHVRGLVRAAQEFIAAHPMPGARFLLAGGFVGTIAAVYDEILRSDALMTLASFAVILLIVAVTYRSLVAAVLLTLPLLVANLVVDSYMAARGIGLDLDTLPVIAVGVGFGIDYGIYLLSRIQEALADGAALEIAVERAIAGSGRTIAFTAVTMTAGVLCFTLTDIRFVSEMAMLLALWMCGSAITSLVLLPALLPMLRPRFLLSPAR
jgi:predicted RND superfamily exporter protein